MRSSKKAIFKLGVYALLVIVVIIPFLVIPRLIVITKVTCSSQYGICPDEITMKLNDAVGKSYIEAREVVTSSVSSGLLVKGYSTRFKLPNQILVDIVLTKPSFGVVSSVNPGFYHLVTSDGLVVNISESTNLPRLTTSTHLPNVGEKVDDTTKFGLVMVESLYNMYQVQDAVVVENHLQAILPSGVRVMFPLDGDREILLGSLRLILSRLNDEAYSSTIGVVREIDLRFKNAVLR